MILPLKIETLMWLLPIVFMIHDFEEIIMFKPWMRKNRISLQTRFPRWAARFLPRYDKLSTSSFALAVAEEFVILAVLTAFAVEFQLYAFWAGILLGFFVHLLIHLLQFAIYRAYVPVIITSVLSSLYCLIALHDLNAYQALVWYQVIGWTLIAVVIIGANIMLALSMAARFEAWLDTTFSER